MNVAIIGSGGREHAICRKLRDDDKNLNLFCIPGNGGTAEIATNLSVDFLNFKKLYHALKFHKINFVIVGPEEPLVKGLVDYLNKKKIKTFGPSKYASQLEGSKAFVKKLCKDENIPTANFKICNKIRDVKNFLDKNNLPIVVKADGIASGKGVKICRKKKEVLDFSNEILKGKFSSSKKIVLENFLEGEEASYFIIVDKKNFKFFGSAQDHKKVGIRDTGLNTGGMGAYSPAQIINNNIEKKILKKIIVPTLRYLKNKRKPFTGFLYAGLMIRNNEPFLIEYNVRMGDPECQVILPRLKTNLLKTLKHVTRNRLNKIKLNWSKSKSMTIVLCSKGYPQVYKKNFIIKDLENIKREKNFFLYHAGTKKYNGKLLSIGGRVLNFTFIGENLKKMRSLILSKIKKLNLKKFYYRYDIGWRVIDKK